MKVMSEEQFSQMMTDLSGIIGEIQDARKNFDAAQMRREIVDELKKSLKKILFLKVLSESPSNLRAT